MTRKIHSEESDIQAQFDARMAEKDKYRKKRENWERDQEKKDLKKQKKNKPVNRKKLQAYEVDGNVDDYDYTLEDNF